MGTENYLYISLSFKGKADIFGGVLKNFIKVRVIASYKEKTDVTEPFELD